MLLALGEKAFVVNPRLVAVATPALTPVKWGGFYGLLTCYSARHQRQLLNMHVFLVYAIPPPF